MSAVTTTMDALRILWKAKMFFKPKVVAEVRKELQKRGYNFTDEALSMALMRAKFLTRNGAKGSYTFVQKFPFVEDEPEKK
jgi:hypothetical protein